MSAGNNFLNVLAFSILMGAEKVLNKSPDYILEKFERYLGNADTDSDKWRWGLDSHNEKILIDYCAYWKLKLPEVELEQ